MIAHRMRIVRDRDRIRIVRDRDRDHHRMYIVCAIVTVVTIIANIHLHNTRPW